MITVDDIRQIAMRLPHVEERPSYGGQPSWRCGPRICAWVRTDPEALVIWVQTIEAKHALCDEAPDRFFTTSHYDDHPVVLVRLDTVDIDEATELITDSWRTRAPKKHLRALTAEG